MKRNIRNAFVIIISVLTLSTAVFAQPAEHIYGQKTLELGLKAFPVYLKSDYQGIVECTIYNIVVLRRYFPNADYNSLVEELNKVAQENTSPSIRYKAHLASMYLTLGGNIKVTVAKTAYDHEKVFRQIADQLEKQLLVSNE